MVCSALQNFCKEAQVVSSEKMVKTAYDEYKNTFRHTRLLVESRNVEEILHRLILLLGEIVDFSALGLLLKEKLSDNYFLHFENKLNEKLAKRVNWLERSGYIKWVCKEGRVSIIPNENQQQNDPSMVLVPLISGKQEMGALLIFLKLLSNDLTPRLIDLLFLLGSQVAVSLENAYLYQDMALQNQAIGNMKSFLENSLESMADGIIAIDLENKISLFNHSSSKYLGLSPVQAIGSKIHQLFSPEFASFLDQALAATYSSGSFESEFEYQNPNNGKKVLLGIRFSVLKNSQKEFIGAIAICRDMSEQQEIIHLRRLDQLKDEFISTVSHELCTPLTSIKSFTEILLNMDDQISETQSEFLEIVAKETNRLIVITNDLLDLSRMNQGDFKIRLETINIQNVLNESLNLTQIMADSKKIKIDTNLDKELLFVEGDFNRLIQVFVNLISNGIKFSSEKSTIKIWSKPLSMKHFGDSEDFLQIIIEDNGIGIPLKYHKTIFEEFKQFSHDSATKPEGSGLELSICKKIIEMLGGNIWVESKKNVGSTFYFTLARSDLFKGRKNLYLCTDKKHGYVD